MHRYYESAVDAISRIVRFDSSQGKRTAQDPFGKENHDCLTYFLDLARSLGFEANDYDGYAGEVVFGNAEEEFAILAHLDVVPAGNGWKEEPFGGAIKDGRIWGRGTVDDKGPAVCCLYALKALKDQGFQPNKKIKLIVGCNEETGWACIDHYKKVAHMPETGFSPDADFPVIYSEKGILHVRFHFPISRSPFRALSGGGSSNMVCDLCTATVTTPRPDDAEKYGLTIEGSKIISRGKSAHGSTPDLGKNAILPLLRYFERQNRDIKRVIACLFDDIYGLKNINDGIDFLTLSPNVVSYRKGELQVVCDIRYPASMQLDEILPFIERFGVKYETVHHQAPLRQNKNGLLVKTLLSVFEECTGKHAEPVSTGGGTYARALKYGVAFGPEMEGDEQVIHQPNEYITLERVNLLLEIYEKAIQRCTI